MKKKSIGLVIVLMSLALFGVMAMQYYFIRESYRLKYQLFNQAVNEALNAVVNKLEKRDAMLFLEQKAEERLELEKVRKQKQKKRQEAIAAQTSDFARRLKIRQQKIDRDFRMRDSLLRQRYPKALVIANSFYETYFRNPDALNKVRFEIKLQQTQDAYGRIFQNEIRELYVESPDPQEQQKLLTNVPSDTVRYLVEDPVLGFQVISLPKVNPKLRADLRQEEEKQVKKVNKYLDSVRTVKQKTAIFEDLAKEYEQAHIPLKQRINPKLVDTLLKQELLNRGINLAYNYQISLTNSDSVIFTRTSNKNKSFLNNDSYHTALFPKELVNQAGILSVTFPNKQSLIFKNMHVVLASSAGLLLILIASFSYTIFTIVRQKKISEMKTDFINNMTHEFKTPVSTIMIASEALKDPEVTEDKKRISRLANIIYDENVRLGNHIERVLHIAKIDKGDLKIEGNPVEMNDLITAVADSMSLQFQKRDANLRLDIRASRATVIGDELHLSSVIFNLLDNAVKYSEGKPEIAITTYNSGKYFVVKVSDKGIGMSKEQLSKIFDQFYRIPTGNIHNVKGFGLGLSYVSNIVKSLRGTIKVKSEKGRGSEFEIIFPTV